MVASEMDAETGRVYRVAGDAQHHHLLCQSCGEVFSISAAILFPVFQQIHETYGFEIWADHLALKGLCERCAQKQPGEQ